MTGDPKVLAGLQQAYLAATNAKVLQRIQIVWDFETSGKIVNNDADADAEIRAWTPPPAEPSLEQRVAELEAKHGALRAKLDKWVPASVTITENHEERIAALERHPEPTAPDDPCGENCDGSCQKCEDRMFERIYGGDDAPAPQPAPDLDPVRVEAAAKAAHGTINWIPEWQGRSEKARTNLVLFSHAVIRAYLKDGGA